MALNLTTSQIYFLRIPLKINPQGFTGIAQNDKFIYTVTQGKKKAILLRIRKKGLDTDLFKETKRIKDPHSMIIFRDKLYIVSSGTNSIEMFDPTTLKYLGKYWQYPLTTPYADQVHMNSLFEYNNQLWTSVFGEKKKNKWSLTDNGSLINTINFSRLYRVYHPHSALSYQGDFYYCESWTGSVFRNNKRIKQIEGSYVRGLDVDADTIIVGLNSGRARSKSQGTLNDPGQLSRFNFYSGILLLNRKRNTESYFDLSEYSRDIYEYTREIYAIKLVKNIAIGNLHNVASHFRISPSNTIKVNLFASLLLNENQNLRIKLSKSTKQKNRLIDEVDILKREFMMVNEAAHPSLHKYAIISTNGFKRINSFGLKARNFLKRIRHVFGIISGMFLFGMSNGLISIASYLFS